MVFAHDTESALLAAVALANSAEPPDTLETVASLEEFFEEHRYSGSHARTREELDEVRALRPRLRELLTADRDEAVAHVNAMLFEAGALPRLVRHDGWDWHLHATPDDAPLASRMAVGAAMAMVDVIRVGQLDRLRTCESTTCDNVLVDLSKNRSRRYCDAGCGNRANVAAYRARKAR